MAKFETTSRDGDGYDPQRYARLIRPARQPSQSEQQEQRERRELTREKLIALIDEFLYGDD
ncbi:hypothetical protein ABH926_008927 [Catenulispora sp. GP43]|uniref:hypothetical protein n=1 Tax=Catenulispora sp. GP43 TaxID=3156263 RepID=UPI003517EC66